MATEEEKQKVRDRQRGYRVDEIKVIKAVEPPSIRDTRIRHNIESDKSFKANAQWYSIDHD